MKYIILTSFCLLISAAVAAQKKLVFEGHYQGKNIFVQNPFKPDGVGFCTDKVLVNDNVTSDQINSSAYEIDFTKLNLKVGDPVTVVIEHGGDCAPKVLNSEVLNPTSTCEWIDVKISDDGMLKWTTKGESGKLPFIIEVYNWNKWIPVGEVDGKGTVDEHSYEFKITAHSGENKVRIRQIDHTKKPRQCQPVTFRSSLPEVTFAPKKVGKDIKFSAKTRYEIYDAYGNLVKKGYGDLVDCQNLSKGVYYLNFDNKNEKFIKK